jgi:hypothetical protein
VAAVLGLGTISDGTDGAFVLPAAVTASVIPRIVPDDATLLAFTAVTVALGTGERKARALLEEHGIPVIELGPRSHRPKGWGRVFAKVVKNWKRAFHARI